MSGPSTQPILEVERLSKEYRSGDAPFPGAAAVDLGNSAGDFREITGKSGACTKTMLNSTLRAH